MTWRALLEKISFFDRLLHHGEASATFESVQQFYHRLRVLIFVKRQRGLSLRPRQLALSAKSGRNVNEAIVFLPSFLPTYKYLYAFENINYLYNILKPAPSTQKGGSKKK